MRFDIIRLFLWGYAKDRVYADKSSTLEHLKINIRQVMAEIPPTQYVSKSGRKLPQTINAGNTLRGVHSNDVCSVSHIMSTIKLYNKKNHEKKYLKPLNG